MSEARGIELGSKEVSNICSGSEADITGRVINVRFVPLADLTAQSSFI